MGYDRLKRSGDKGVVCIAKCCIRWWIDSNKVIYIDFYRVWENITKQR